MCTSEIECRRAACSERRLYQQQVNDFRACVSIKNRLHRESGSPEYTGDGIPLQAIRSGISLNGIGSELWFFFFLVIFFLLQLVSFTVDSDPLYPTGGVDRYTSHVIFPMHFYTQSDVHTHCMAQDEPPNASVFARHSIFMPSMIERLIVRSLSVSSCLSCSCVSLLFASSLPHPTRTLTCTPSMSTASRELTTAPSDNEEYCFLAIYHPPTGHEPNVLDDYCNDLPGGIQRQRHGALVLV